jgi:hypothetical protein
MAAPTQGPSLKRLDREQLWRDFLRHCGGASPTYGLAHRFIAKLASDGAMGTIIAQAALVCLQSRITIRAERIVDPPT